MICPRHHAIASNMEHGYPYCVGCFREAITKAEDKLLEDRMAELFERRYTSVDALMQRLGWRA
jgi:hypothetical protein